jgi:gamma-glutamylcyclotransferase (GGCT)/AIG2-like uncharacterized protein YtfP
MDSSATLFVYGTLLEADRLEAVTGRRFQSAPAVLDAHARVMSPAGYPYAVPRAGARIEGMLLFDVDARSLGRLDAYESEGVLYFRRPVEARCGEERVPCQVYLGNPAALAARPPARTRSVTRARRECHWSRTRSPSR